MNLSGRLSLTSVRFFLVVNLVIALLARASALAQNPSPQPGGPLPGTAAPNAPATTAGAAAGAEAERVIVTGSNIPTAEEVGPNPVLSYNRDLISKSGERNTEQLLKDQPVANASSVPVQNNGTAQGGPTG